MTTCNVETADGKLALPDVAAIFAEELLGIEAIAALRDALWELDRPERETARKVADVKRLCGAE